MGAVQSCAGHRRPQCSIWNSSRTSMKTPYDKKSRNRNVSAAFNMLDTDVTIEQLNINLASEEDLMTLKGIDRPTAHNIVEHRRQIGAFKVSHNSEEVKEDYGWCVILVIVIVLNMTY